MKKSKKEALFYSIMLLCGVCVASTTKACFYCYEKLLDTDKYCPNCGRETSSFKAFVPQPPPTMYPRDKYEPSHEYGDNPSVAFELQKKAVASTRSERGDTRQSPALGGRAVLGHYEHRCGTARRLRLLLLVGGHSWL